MIRNRLVASLTVLFLLGGWPERAEASSVKGYMITLHQDTIYGRIQLPWMLSSMDFFNLFGFDYVSMSCQVFFKSEAEKSYHRYTPLMISGYGFVHRRTIYIYKSFDLKYKSILEDKSKGFRFLNLIHAGTVDLYRYPITITYPIQSTIDRGREMMYYEYYVCSDAVGLQWVGPTDTYATLKELLQFCQVEDDYCRTISKDMNFKDIWTVLVDYEKWLSNKTHSLTSH